VSKIRIAMVAGLAGPGPIAGGVWKVALTQAEALAEAGHDVKLVTGWLSPNLPSRMNNYPDVIVLRLRRTAPRSGLRMLRASRRRDVVRRIATWADVTHVHLCRDFFTAPTAIQLSKAGLPVLAQCHGMLSPSSQFLFRAYDRLLMRAAISSVDSFLTLTDRERTGLRRMGVADAKMLPVNNATSDPNGSWSDPALPSFLFASRLHSRKQPMVFVSAALQLLRNGHEATFVIAGPDQGQGAAVRSMIEQSGYQHAFQIVGPLEHSTLMSALSQSTAMVLPSVEEPYPMIVLEAAALGVPSIVTRDIGIRTELECHDAALLVEPNAGAVAHAMSVLIQDPAQRRQLSRNSRLTYDAYWRPSALGSLLVGYYQRHLSISEGEDGQPVLDSRLSRTRLGPL
jgi:glycosyltransferase involved in cell wall biosynthesis